MIGLTRLYILFIEGNVKVYSNTFIPSPSPLNVSGYMLIIRLVANCLLTKSVIFEKWKKISKNRWKFRKSLKNF